MPVIVIAIGQQSKDMYMEGRSTVRDYIREATENPKQRKLIKPAKTKILVIPIELLDRFKTDKPLRDRYEDLPLTKKREFAEYILTALQEETKQRRLEQIVPMILGGVSLNDSYR